MAKRGKYVLREFSYNAQPAPSTSAQDQTDNKLSLNRCTASSLAYVPHVFKLAPLTPNKLNDCHRGRRFVMVDYASELYANGFAAEEVVVEQVGECVLDPFPELVTAVNADPSVGAILRNVMGNPHTSASALLPVEENADNEIALGNDRLTVALASEGVCPLLQSTPSREEAWKYMIVGMNAHQKHVDACPMDRAAEGYPHRLAYLCPKRRPDKKHRALCQMLRCSLVLFLKQSSSAIQECICNGSWCLEE